MDVVAIVWTFVMGCVIWRLVNAKAILFVCWTVRTRCVVLMAVGVVVLISVVSSFVF